MAPKQSPFFKAPIDIRQLIYDQLIQDHRDVHYQRLAEREDDRGTSSPASEQAGSTMRLNILLTNKQMYHEYQDAWYAANPSSAVICEALLEPKSVLPKTGPDTAYWRGMVINARRFELIAHAGSSMGGTDDGYSVNVIFLQGRGSGYRLEWQHMSEQQRDWFKISNTQYQTMVARVEAVIPATIASRKQTSNGISGFTWEGAEQLFEAFQMQDLLSADTDAADDGHAQMQNIKTVAWNPLESNNEHAWY
ncbi:hypothetical protein LTR17_000605 [Elasticomyces elasticus]|nr:hypothetical protein LTR17_000605 [Elasticomyces elasticus]